MRNEKEIITLCKQAQNHVLMKRVEDVIAPKVLNFGRLS
jgi:hypothetical protein